MPKINQYDYPPMEYMRGIPTDSDIKVAKCIRYATSFPIAVAILAGYRDAIIELTKGDK